MALSVAPSFFIEETTGRGRTIELKGRALPYQGVGFGGEMRHSTTWYAGNPIATMQVLGPTLENTTIEGMWSDRFLPGQFELTGFPDLAGFDGTTSIQTAEVLIRAFEQLRDSGNALRVQWFHTARQGIIKNFTPTWIRPQDCKWSVEFTWFAADLEQPIRAAFNDVPAQDMLTKTTSHDDAFVAEPAYIAPAFSSSVEEATNNVRVQAGQIFDQIRQAQDTIKVPAQNIQACVAAASSLRSYANQEVAQLTELPYTYAQTGDSVIQVLGCEDWRRLLARNSDSLTATSLRTSQQFQENVLPGSLAVVTVPGDTTLRQLSTTYYGTPDSWTIIADANDLTDSLVAAGTVLVIPAIASSGFNTTSRF
jgi:nucleoid-associated protein YgaU